MELMEPCLRPEAVGLELLELLELALVLDQEPELEPLEQVLLVLIPLEEWT